MENGIKIDGPSVTVESAVAVSGAIVEVLRVCGEQRTPESVQLAAIQAIGESLRGHQSIHVVGSTIEGDKTMG